MNRFNIQRAMATILLSILVSALFASVPLITTDQVSAYVIQDYAFSVKGKTKEFALRSVVYPSGGDPVFLTEEAMVEALGAKRQGLINKRIFTSVEYEYALDSYSKGTAYYTATFFIEDASTFLIIPFPKFDNDKVGFRLGVKMYAPNLLGTFSDLYVGGSISQGNGGTTGWDNREDVLVVELASFPIGRTFLDFSFDYERKKGSSDAGKFNFAFDWKNLTLYGSKLNIAPWGKFNPSSDFSSWNPVEYGLSWNLGPFKQNESYFSLYNKIKVHENLTELYTLTHLDQLRLSFFSHPISFRISSESNGVIGSGILSTMEVGMTLGTEFSLPLGIKWASSLGAFLHYKPSYVLLPYSYLVSNTLSKSNINWRGDFRKGLKFSLNFTTDLYPQAEYWDTKTSWSLSSAISWFPIANSWFNPSIQLRAFKADAVVKKDHFSNDAIAEYMRGYLTKTITDMGLGGFQEFGAIMNLNLTTKFIDFGFAKSYASPFLDIGVFPNAVDPDNPILLASAGLDGWGILNKFPSYPIRGSLGFNLSDVRRAIEKEIGFTEIEWELYIGMGLFF